MTEQVAGCIGFWSPTSRASARRLCGWSKEGRAPTIRGSRLIDTSRQCTGSHWSRNPCSGLNVVLAMLHLVCWLHCSCSLSSKASCLYLAQVTSIDGNPILGALYGAWAASVPFACWLTGGGGVSFLDIWRPPFRSIDPSLASDLGPLAPPRFLDPIPLKLLLIC